MDNDGTSTYETKLSIEVETHPESLKFFHVTEGVTEPDDTLTIDTNELFNDAGQMATDLPVLAEDNSYYTVSINGVM